MMHRTRSSKALSFVLAMYLVFQSNTAILASTMAPSGPVQVIYMGDSIVCRGDLNGYAVLAIGMLSQQGITGGFSRSSEYSGGTECTIMPLNKDYLPDSVTKFSPSVFHFNPGIDQVTGLCGSRAAHFEKFGTDLKAFIQRFNQDNPNKIFVYGLSTRADETVIKNGAVERRDVDVRELNLTAMRVCRELGVPAFDLHSPCVKNNWGTSDGRHLTAQGGVGIAAISADLVKKYLPYASKAGAPWIQITNPSYVITPILGQEVTSGQNVTVSIEAGGATIAKVELYDNDVKVGEDNAAPYEIVVPAISQGAHRLVAKLIDGSGVDFPSPEVRIYATGSPVTATTPLKINCGFVDADGYTAAKEWTSDRDFGYSGIYAHRANISNTDGFSKEYGQVNQWAHLSQDGEIVYRVRVRDNAKYHIGMTTVVAKGFDKFSGELTACGKKATPRLAPQNVTISRGVPVTYTCSVQPVDNIITLALRNNGGLPPLSAIIVQSEPIQQTTHTGVLVPLTLGTTSVARGATPAIAGRFSAPEPSLFFVNGRKSDVTGRRAELVIQTGACSGLYVGSDGTRLFYAGQNTTLTPKLK